MSSIESLSTSVIPKQVLLVDFIECWQITNGLVVCSHQAPRAYQQVGTCLLRKPRWQTDPTLIKLVLDLGLGARHEVIVKSRNLRAKDVQVPGSSCLSLELSRCQILIWEIVLNCLLIQHRLSGLLLTC